MSRSYKKPYITDQQNRCVRQWKRDANKAIRNKPEDEAPANGKAYRKEYCSWNIRDYSYYIGKPTKGGKLLFGFHYVPEAEMIKQRRKAERK